MVAVVCMSMVVHPAIAKVKQMGYYYQYHRCRKQPYLVVVPVLFGKQQQYSGRKDGQGPQAVVMFAIAMPEGVAANGHCQPYHKVFERMVINYFVAHYRQAGKEQGQQGAMDGASHRSTDAHYVPVDLHMHRKRRQI